MTDTFEVKKLGKDLNLEESQSEFFGLAFFSKEGIITIAGGKLTGYRKMAQRVIDLIFKKDNIRKRKSLTKNLKLYGNNYKKLKSQILDLGFTQDQFNKYYDNYGDECQEIFSTIKEGSKEDSVLIISEYRFCIKNEMCHTLLDFFSQRNSMVYYKLGEVFPFINQNEKEMRKIADISDQKWKNQLDDLKKYMNQITTFN